MTRNELASLRVNDIVKKYAMCDYAYGVVRRATDAFIVIQWGWGTTYDVIEDPSSGSIYALDKSDSTPDELRRKYEWMKPLDA